jgi:hypothetical protein
MRSAIYLIDEWEVKDSLIGLCFDTTASKTGIRNGCATLIESKLKPAILWLPCRHHIQELHVKHAFSAVFGERSGPDDLIFKRFQSQWEESSKDTNDLQLFEWPSFEREKDAPQIFYQAQATRNWLEAHIEKGTFPREDYRELAELNLIWLGGTLPNSRKFFIRKPGAVHHARFMAKSIYLLKMVIYYLRELI